MDYSWNFERDHSWLKAYLLRLEINISTSSSTFNIDRWTVKYFGIKVLHNGLKFRKKCNFECKSSESVSLKTINFITYFIFDQRACLLRALMCQAVLWGIKNGCRATKILMNDFFSIPLHLAKKKFFSTAPWWCCLTRGRVESTFWGVNDVASKRNFA